MRDAVHRIRMQRDLPRFVVVEERDNELPVDFENPLSVEGFAELMKKGAEGPLFELFPGPEQLCVAGENGRFVHEMFVPFLLDKAPADGQGSNPPASTTPSGSRVTRHRPGSEWLYVKLYTGEARADQLLSEAVAPLVRWARSAQLVDRWFFLRYSDPNHHIRLRFRGDVDGLYGPFRERLRRALAGRRFKTAVWKEQWDTYLPETERYGGAEGLAISEELFQIDSDTVLAVLPAASSDIRWTFAYAGVDRLLASLGMSHEERMACVERLRDGFFREFGLESSDRQRMGVRFREHRPLLMSLLEEPARWPEPLRGKASVYLRNGQKAAVCAKRLRELERRGRLGVPFGSLAASYVHMHVNRVLRSSQREHEAVIYHFLAQSYRSLLAIRSSAGSEAHGGEGAEE
jgi:thiopeptide-type bacteriocin biosynthesis protein